MSDTTGNKYFYFCDKKCDCHYRPDGKRNEYCGTECKHTSDINHAFYKEKERIFVDRGHGLRFEYIKPKDVKGEDYE